MPGPADPEPVAGSLLAHLEPADRRLLLDRGTPRTFPADEVVLRQGDPTDHVLVLVSGWVRVDAVTRDGGELLVAFRGPGDVLGDLAALRGSTQAPTVRTATVRTLTAITAVQLRRERFVELLETRPSITLGLARQMASRLVQAETARTDAATLDVNRRVAVYLARLLPAHGVHTPEGVVLTLPLTQQDIAHSIGASLRAVARAISLLRDRGIVEPPARGRILVTRPEVLTAFLGDPPNGT